MVTKKVKSLKNKKILITAGPTSVSLDSVRLISNIASGRTGILLANELSKLGAKVTFLLGSTEYCLPKKDVKILRFKFFDELKNLLFSELKSQRYDVVVHSAAVSDYKPATFYSGKLKPGKKSWKIILIPTEKIIDRIKQISKGIFLVGFKFEPGEKRKVLIEKAQKLKKRSSLDLVVANSIVRNHYFAYIINKDYVSKPILTKEKLAKELVSAILNNIK